MSIHFKVVMAIVKKDVHGLLPLILLGLAVFVAQPLIANFNLEREAEIWSVLQTAFYWLGYFVATLLMISVLQLDPATSLSHDWLSRPISRLDWLLAKLVFLFSTVCVPVVLAHFVVNLWTGYDLGRSIGDALAIEIPPALLATPIFFAIALLTPTLKKLIVVVVILCMTFIVPAWDGGRRLLSHIGIDISNNFASMMWVQALPLLVLGIGSALLVYWFVYCRRRPDRGWIAFCVSFALVFLCLFPPAAIYGWDQVLAIHRWLINQPGEDSLDDQVILEHSLGCFPAAPANGSSTTAPVLAQAAWDDPIIEDAGPGALTFATTVKSRNTLVESFSSSNTTMDVRVHWLVDRIRVRGRFVADSIPGEIELTRSSTALNKNAPISSVDTDYWLVPGRAVDALAHDPTTRLILDYDLALLSPTTYQLKPDGQRREFPELGSCRAQTNSGANTIEVDCLKEGAQPALVSAELVGVSAGRVDSNHQASYVPGWALAIGRKHYELTLKFPKLVDSSVIMITAYKAERILHKRLETQGVLGAPRSMCPLPEDDLHPAVERSNWSDKSPHKISSIAVEHGVRVEVLDWRTAGAVGKPVLFLIPGLGATAHSYDDLAVQLAQKYAVVGMTRRGVDGSSKPDHGYDIARLSQDVLEVLDTLAIESPILVGHSIGGEELSYLGAHYPERFAGLVYLDAAYDRTGLRNDTSLPESLLPDRPPPRPSDLVSYAALKRYMLRTIVGPHAAAGDESTFHFIPEGEIMASYDLNTGAIKHDPLYLDAVEMGLEPPDYAHIPLPALAIYAMPTSPERLMRAWYDRDDPETRRAVEQAFRWQARVKKEQIARFREGVANSHVLVLDDADHWIFVSNEEDVLKAIDAFVDRL